METNATMVSAEQIKKALREERRKEEEQSFEKEKELIKATARKMLKKLERQMPLCSDSRSFSRDAHKYAEKYGFTIVHLDGEYLLVCS